MKQPIDEQKFESYVAGWRARARVREQARRQQVQRALEEAYTIAQALRDRFGAREVWIFGSLARELRGAGGFREGSDIDMAARGVAPECYFSALAVAMELAARNVDLVEIDDCPVSLKTAIEREGVKIFG